MNKLLIIIILLSTLLFLSSCECIGRELCEDPDYIHECCDWGMQCLNGVKCIIGSCGDGFCERGEEETCPEDCVYFALNVTDILGKYVLLNSQTTGKIDFFSFDWGDGTTVVGNFPQEHKYNYPGTYNISVKAYKNESMILEKSSTINIDDSCIISGIPITKNTMLDFENDVKYDVIDILEVSATQVSKEYLQLSLIVKNPNVPFMGHAGPRFNFHIDTLDTRGGEDYRIEIIDVSGSGVNETWHSWLMNNNENGRIIQHYPSIKLGNTFITLVPLNLMQRERDTIIVRTESSWQNINDHVNSFSITLNNTDTPIVSIDSSGDKIFGNNAHFNNLSKGGLLTFNLVDNFGPKPINFPVEFYSSFEKRLNIIEKDTFIGNGVGISMVYAYIDNCFVVPEPIVVNNGNFLYEGTRTAFILGNNYTQYSWATQITDILSQIESNLVGNDPHEGQFLIVDERDSNVLAGPEDPNPIPVPLYTPTSPMNAWWYFGHEYGHHFHGNIFIFTQLVPGQYGESLPSEISLYALQEMISLHEEFGLTPEVTENLQRNLDSTKDDFMRDLGKYEAEGAPFKALSQWQTPYDPNNVFNGMIVRIEENFGRNTIENFFKLFQKDYKFIDPPVINQIRPNTLEETHTMWVLLWSLAAEQDLRPFFQQWNYPIQEEYYNRVKPVVESLLLV
ncbi:hypothetical protein ACFLZX_00390 [Nanoarchaeota archaeon]